MEQIISLDYIKNYLEKGEILRIYKLGENNYLAGFISKTSIFGNKLEDLTFMKNLSNIDELLNDNKLNCSIRYDESVNKIVVKIEHSYLDDLGNTSYKLLGKYIIQSDTIYAGLMALNEYIYTSRVINSNDIRENDDLDKSFGLKKVKE